MPLKFCYWGINTVGTCALSGCSLEQWRHRIGTFGAKCVRPKLCLRSFIDILSDILECFRLCLTNIRNIVPVQIMLSFLALFAISLLLPIILFSMTLYFHVLQMLNTKYEHENTFIIAMVNSIYILSVPFKRKK